MGKLSKKPDILEQTSSPGHRSESPLTGTGCERLLPYDKSSFSEEGICDPPNFEALKEDTC